MSLITIFQNALLNTVAWIIILWICFSIIWKIILNIIKRVEEKK